MEVFREIFQICPRLPNQDFDEHPSDEEIVSFIKELGHKGNIKSITDVDDCVLSTMRFISKSKNFRVYGALLIEVMTNQKMWNSHANKTYLAYSTGVATPRKARKFKKPASPSKKRTLVTVEEEEPKPAKKVVSSHKPSRKQSAGVVFRDTPGVTTSKKKTPATTDKSKGIELLSDVVALEAAQLKKVIKRSKQDTSIHQADSSGDGTGSKPGVLDEPKGKFVDTNEGTSLKPRVPKATNEGTSLKPRVPKMSKADSSESEIDKELYSDVNIRLTNAEQDDEGEEHPDMTDVAHVQNATTDVPPFRSSHSISSNYTSAFFNLENLQSTEMEVVSMLDINVQHEVPRTSQLHTIPVSVIPELTIFNPSKTVTTALATTITSLISSLFPNLHQSIPIPTPRNTEATTSTPTVLESETLNAIHLRLSDMEKEVKELKNVDHSSALLSKIKSVVLNAIKEYLETNLDYALYKVLKKHDANIIKEFLVLAEIVERLTQQYLPQQSTEKSTKDIRKIKMEHASKQQVP
ncbi:hypothetical protein Tco_0605972 [Tanacetum coccineum]